MLSAYPLYLGVLKRETLRSSPWADQWIGSVQTGPSGGACARQFACAGKTIFVKGFKMFPKSRPAMLKIVLPFFRSLCYLRAS